VSFLHTESFRLSETWAREHPRVTEHDRSIRSERWIKGQGLLGKFDTGELIDTYFCYEVFVPGVLLMTVRTYPVGTADALNGQPPDLNQEADEFTSQAITPLTDKTARYFYTMGQRRRGDETVYDLTTTEKAFAEDKMMIEAQQRNIDVTPGWRFISIAADRGTVLFNRLVEKLAREESAGSSIASPPAVAHQ
jgi:vanillate O-demethylase monooxygenase subunit